MKRFAIAYMPWAFSILIVLLDVSAVVLALLNGRPWWHVLYLINPAVAAGVSALLISRRPENKVGWIIAVFALTFTLGEFGRQYALYGMLTNPGSLPLAHVLASLPYWIWFIGLVAVFIYLPLYFPDGRLPGPGWHWLPWVATLVSLLISLAAGLQYSDVETPGINNPLGVPALASDSPVGEFLSQFAVLVWLGLAAVATFSQWVRFRRAPAQERQQIKWFAYAAIMTGVVNVAVLIFLNEHLSDFLREVIFTLALSAVWIAIMTAVLRYRLYDIDLLIRRTLIYSVLTTLLAALYFVLVVVLQALFVPLTGLEQSNLALVLSTLGIAATFRPLRQRVQRSIDRRFYRRKYDAGRILRRFSDTAQTHVELEPLTSDLLLIIQQTMEPEHVTIWLKEQ